jgi:hypothetical protein
MVSEAGTPYSVLLTLSIEKAKCKRLDATDHSSQQGYLTSQLTSCIRTPYGVLHTVEKQYGRSAQQ